MRKTLIIIISALVCVNAIAQENNELTVKRIFGSDDFTRDRLPVSKWVDGGEFYTTVDESKTIDDVLTSLKTTL